MSKPKRTNVLTRREVMDAQNVILPGWPVEQVTWMMLTGVENLIEFLDACIRMPKKVILMCLRFPKQLVMLPFNVLNRITAPFLYLAKMKSVPIITLEIYDPTSLLTGEKNPSPESIISACRKIRCSTLRSLLKPEIPSQICDDTQESSSDVCNVTQESSSETSDVTQESTSPICDFKQRPSQICDYKQLLDKWKLESQKRTEEIYKIGSEDKELMKSVASGLRSLKVLKNKRELMHINFNRSVSAMINEGTVSAEKLLALKKLMKVGDANILDRKNAVLDLMSDGRLDDLTDSGYASPVKDDQLPDDSGSDSSVETLKKVLELVSEENSLLRSQLSCTLDKVEEILRLSKNINNEVSTLDEKFSKMGTFNNEIESLQDKLDEERALLMAVQADRDFMKSKLKTLENLIKDEEEYLGESRFEPGFEDLDCSIAADIDVSELSSSSS